METSLSIDFDADAAYLQLHEGEVVETQEVAPGVLVDLDQNRVVLGIEILDLDVFIPYTVLIQQFHVRQDEVRFLDYIRPKVTSFVQRQQLQSASPTQNPALQPC